VGASLEVIQKKRAEKPEVRDAAREAALRYVCQLYDKAIIYAYDSGNHLFGLITQ
jgi:hypothetical protein